MGTNDILENIIRLYNPDEGFRVVIVHSNVLLK